MLGNRRRVVGIRQPLGPVREQRAELDVAEAGEREVEAGKLQLAEFEPQQLRVPTRPGNRKLVVGQDVGPLLRLGPACRTMTGISAMPSCQAASTLAWPAIRPPSSPTSAGVVQPHSLMLAAIAATWASVWVRALFAYGISLSIPQRSTLSAGHGL